MPMDKLPSGRVRYPSNSWGALARDPSLDVGIVGEALAETVRQNWLESGGTEGTFEETFPQFAEYAQNNRDRLSATFSHLFYTGLVEGALAPVPRSLSKSRSNILGVRRLDAEAASPSIDETIFGLNAIELRFAD
jgi:hypothetical protein